MIVPIPCPQRKVGIWELISLSRGNRKYSEEELGNGKNYRSYLYVSTILQEVRWQKLFSDNLAVKDLRRRAQVSNLARSIRSSVDVMREAGIDISQ